MNDNNLEVLVIKVINVFPIVTLALFRPNPLIMKVSPAEYVNVLGTETTFVTVGSYVKLQLPSQILYSSSLPVTTIETGLPAV